LIPPDRLWRDDPPRRVAGYNQAMQSLTRQRVLLAITGSIAAL